MSRHRPALLARKRENHVSVPFITDERQQVIGVQPPCLLPHGQRPKHVAGRHVVVQPHHDLLRVLEAALAQQREAAVGVRKQRAGVPKKVAVPPQAVACDRRRHVAEPLHLDRRLHAADSGVVHVKRQ